MIQFAEHIFQMGWFNHQLPTPPKFSIAPEKWWLEDEFPFGIAYF